MMNEKITIGGREVEVRLKDKTCKMIIEKFYQIRVSEKHNDWIEEKLKELDYIFKNSFQYYDDCKNKDMISDDEYKIAKAEMNKLRMDKVFILKNFIPDPYYMWAIYKLIVKRGIWPFRYPFRSYRHMRKEINKDEFINMGILINTHVIKVQNFLNSSALNH